MRDQNPISHYYFQHMVPQTGHENQEHHHLKGITYELTHFPFMPFNVASNVLSSLTVML